MTVHSYIVYRGTLGPNKETCVSTPMHVFATCHAQAWDKAMQKMEEEHQLDHYWIIGSLNTDTNRFCFGHTQGDEFAEPIVDLFRQMPQS